MAVYWINREIGKVCNVETTTTHSQTGRRLERAKKSRLTGGGAAGRAWHGVDRGAGGGGRRRLRPAPGASAGCRRHGRRRRRFRAPKQHPLGVLALFLGGVHGTHTQAVVFIRSGVSMPRHTDVTAAFRACVRACTQ